MKFCWSANDTPPDDMWVFTSPNRGFIHTAIKEGTPWAGDNDAFTGFDDSKYLGFIKKMEPYRDTCQFICAPDVVGDAIGTLELYERYYPHLEGWRIAFVAQDGQEDHDFPMGFSTLFIGGSTKWKLSQGAIDCIKRAQVLGKHIHIGRINHKKRYDLFRRLEGSEEFTCDGTRVAYYGREETLKAWRECRLQPPLVYI